MFADSGGDFDSRGLGEISALLFCSSASSLCRLSGRRDSGSGPGTDSWLLSQRSGQTRRWGMLYSSLSPSIVTSGSSSPSSSPFSLRCRLRKAMASARLSTMSSIKSLCDVMQV